MSRADDTAMADATGAAPETDTSAAHSQRLPPTTAAKPIPYTFDLGHLLAHDPSPLPPQPSEAALAANARSAAQAIINQLFAACAFSSTASGVAIALPAPSTPLPREKAVPDERKGAAAGAATTRWERFAAKKGIKPRRRDERGRMEFDEAKGEWVPRWGYKGRNKDGEADWLVEVDEREERRTGEPGDARRQGRAERKERARRNERRQRANERRAGRGG